MYIRFTAPIHDMSYEAFAINHSALRKATRH